ncbi:MAG: AtpZ/AtpI family protein [Syntrophales bacterium]|nr:AtpZ/AtpI family protein [Syntrophales bacterium]MDD5641639.1 AtpZ/AtpI family protein [Syntrophales bacterium]
MREDTKKFLKELFSGGYQASAIGLSLVLAIAIGGGIGWWLANYFDNNIFFYIGLILGIIAGFRNVYLMGKKLQK